MPLTLTAFLSPCVLLQPVECGGSVGLGRQGQHPQLGGRHDDGARSTKPKCVFFALFASSSLSSWVLSPVVACPHLNSNTVQRKARQVVCCVSRQEAPMYLVCGTCFSRRRRRRRSFMTAAGASVPVLLHIIVAGERLSHSLWRREQSRQRVTSSSSNRGRVEEAAQCARARHTTYRSRLIGNGLCEELVISLIAYTSHVQFIMHGEMY